MNSLLKVFALLWLTFCVFPSAHSDSQFLTPEEYRVYDQLKKQDCGIQKQGVNGGKDFVMSQPWMAYIYDEKNIQNCRCGGTLISESFVLTSAHCLAFCPSSSEFKVRLGEHSPTASKYCKQTICAPPVKHFSINESVFYDNFVYYQFGNDIALLRLDRKVVFKDHIRPICLPLTPDLQAITSFMGQSYTALKWMQTGKIPKETLVEEHVNTVQCSVDTHESFLCTTENTECRENSGGPLIWLGRYFGSTRHLIFGLASHGKGPCGNGQKAYYTDLPAFMPWILKTLAKFPTL
ncbi:serine protease grass-like [Drosophila elegans]|uniref:serine protease grass-like n=1 Tax=Drosophila elegans TaxID=30023 RepID=UPI0007E73901|nr:serine protease grass-like [Drosophila elegans]